MGSVTEIIRKSRLTPVMAVLLAFIAMDLAVLLGVVLKEMQSKFAAGKLDAFDWALLAVAMMGCVGKTVASFMNKGWTRYADERDAEHKEEADLKRNTKPPAEADGGNLR